MQEIIGAYYDFWFGVNEAYEQWAKDRGLTANALFVLYAICEQPEVCTQRLICERLLLPKQTVHTILDDLERKGFLYRAPSLTDKRSKQVLLTADGQAYAGKLLSELSAAEAKALKAMTPAQRHAFITTSHTFLHNLTAAFQEKKED